MQLLLVWLPCAVFSHYLLNRLLPRRDPLLLPIVLLISGWGIALVWRLAPAFGLRQTLWLPIGLVGMFAVIRAPGDLRWLRRFKYTWLIAALALTALTLVFGVNPSGGGERLWLGCCGLYFQPSEALKLLLVVYLAAYLADKRELMVVSSQRSVVSNQTGRALTRDLLPLTSYLQYVGPLVLMWSLSLVLLISQRDLGTGSLIFVVFLTMLYLASGQKRYLLAGLILLVVGGAVAYWRFDVVKLRVEAWLNPWLDPGGRSFQIVQSLMALSAGGLFGRGLGLGAPTAIPVVHSDFVFAAITEEWGLLGAFAALALILGLVMRGLRAAALARGPFRSLLAAGLASLLGVQSFLIVGGVVKLIPLTGLTLPFLSYGGSSLLANFIIVGLLLRLSHDAA
ncbi:MAG: FtsW/RodA/SpoVE family cell cycle protein [Chloroflexi bacterium]|nr:FtsW/RodA/SpoVE family cell cycle protein [Chloroflexota bacterium]MBI3762608.1 FtsW/RodA/SpoVE family cell cycle protein [Chloroflexota bacterium]